jgi:hypothetical protein
VHLTGRLTAGLAAPCRNRQLADGEARPSVASVGSLPRAGFQEDGNPYRCRHHEHAEEELSPARPAVPIDYTAQLAAPLLGLFGNDDTHPSPAQVDQHEAELKRHGKGL